MILEGLKIIFSYWVYFEILVLILGIITPIILCQELIKKGKTKKSRKILIKKWKRNLIKGIRESHSNSILEVLEEIRDFPKYIASSMIKIYGRQKEILTSIIINYFIISWTIKIISSYPKGSNSSIFISLGLVMYLMIWTGWLFHKSFAGKIKDNLLGFYDVYGYFILIILGIIFIRYEISVILGTSMLGVVIISVILNIFNSLKVIHPNKKQKGGKNGKRQKQRNGSTKS